MELSQCRTPNFVFHFVSFPELSFQNNESGLPDSCAGARLRQQLPSLSAKRASPGRFCIIGNDVSYDTKNPRKTRRISLETI